MNTLAPVAIFAYRRPDHLRSTLVSLMRCDGFSESPVYVFFDGPRSADEMGSVMATRELARELLGDRATYHYSEVNQGLSRSIISGTTEVINHFGRAIVVEDDLKLHPFFLLFMNRALDQYADEENVYQVSGFMYDLPELREETSAFFLPFTVSWGWATWERAWNQIDLQATGWESLRSDRKLRDRFNLHGAYDYTNMLTRQMAGLRDSWAIRWYWSVFKANGLVLFPPVSLVSNMGFDGSGTHGRGLVRKYSKNPLIPAATEFVLPVSVQLHAQFYARVREGIRRQNGGWAAKTVDLLRRLLN